MTSWAASLKTDDDWLPNKFRDPIVVKTVSYDALAPGVVGWYPVKSSRSKIVRPPSEIPATDANPFVPEDDPFPPADDDVATAAATVLALLAPLFCFFFSRF